jgi:quinolinate synthase
MCARRTRRASTGCRGCSGGWPERSWLPWCIVGTETGNLHTTKKPAPHKVLIEVPQEDRTAACQGCNACPHMKKNTLEKIYPALRDLRPRIEMPEALRLRALAPLERMLALG